MKSTEEVVFELVYERGEWRVLDPAQSVLGSADTPFDAVVSAQDSLWECVGDGVDWKRKAVDELDVTQLPEGLRASASALIELWRADIYGEPESA